ncbi:hypothetical protein [Poritiphilus flavus]|uniref:Uncharacterized protein n=1 Tax=Poritiphilus flavus TaxID=2697053 RepID=A0A6L9EFV6_9FLAO|nr:hypothetical protein [Poritiphilus flavus]NAS13571.1 hypothetical protein [Poritiphilus flavus]
MINKSEQEHALAAQHVFTENNEVFIKKTTAKGQSAGRMEETEWFPVNFQWIPVMELRRKMRYESNL